MSRQPKQSSAVSSNGDLSWDEAIRTVLSDAGGALHYGEITDRIIASKLRRSIGATPKDTVATTLSISLRDERTPYVRVDRGVYTLKVAPEAGAPTGKPAPIDNIAETSEATGAVQAFGMFWERAAVQWSQATPKLFGRQNVESAEVDFSGQIGVYLLHDRDRVIYVGRAGDSRASRLKAHTRDRLGGRWDRFSWFGLRSVRPNAQLADGIVSWSQEVVINTMEALLIESLEPPLNRKRGDNFSAAEYLQATDPQIEMERRKAIAEEIIRGGLRGGAA